MSDAGTAPAVVVGHQRDTARRLVRNLTALAGGQVATWTMTLLWTLVVPRALGPTGLGLVVAGMSISGVFGLVLGLGTKTYLVRCMVVDADASRSLLGTAIVLRLLLTPVFVVGIIVYAHVLHESGEGATVLYLVSAATLGTLLAEPMQAGFQAIERMKYLAYSDVINKAAQSLLGIAIVAIGFRATGIAASMAAVAASVVVLNAIWIRRYIAIDLHTTWTRVVSMARESVAYWAFAVFSMLYLWIDTIMLSLMTRPEVVGWYGAPLRLFQTLMFLPVLLSTAWLPRLVSAFGEGEGALQRAARRPIELVLVLSAPMAAGTAMVAGIVVPVLYGPAYTKAVPVLILLGLCLPPMYLSIMLSNVLLAAKRQKIWTWIMVVATIVNPVFNLIAIPLTERLYGNGAIGAAVSLLATELGLVTIGLVIVGRSVLDRAAVRRCVLATAASAAMWGAGLVSRPLGDVPSVVIGVATFVVLALVLRVVTQDELQYVRARVRRAVAGRRRV